jgi:serine phosphatase RsbU (regulator of sigma subunit)
VKAVARHRRAGRRALIENAFAHRREGSPTAARDDRDAALPAQVQHDLLPRSWPVLPGIQVHAAARPASAVGGDFYDVLPLGTHGLFAAWGTCPARACRRRS